MCVISKHVTIYYDLQADMIVSCMLKDARRHAGLGNPPTAYYNNIPESANAMIKRGVKFKESEMTTFCKEMSILLSRQKEDIESAIFNHGPYRMAPKFSSHKVSPDSWFQMSTKQKETHLKKFHSETMSEEKSEQRDVNSQSSTSTQGQVNLSVDLAKSGLTCAPAVTLQCIANKAKELLNKEGSVVRAPGSDSATFVVESQTSEKPHYVTQCKNGKVTCNDCPGWKASKICSHAVAVAEKTSTLAKYVKWLREKGPASMNITALVTCDSSSGTGKKSGKKSTARRKGGRTANDSTITTVVDRPFLIPAVPLSDSSRQNGQSPSVPAPVVPPQSTYQPGTRLVPAPVVQPQSTYQPGTSPVPASVVPPQSIYQPGTSPASAEVPSFVVNLLRFCPPMVRMCYGCSQTLKPGGVIANPPYDMTITSRMNRCFRTTPGGELNYKEGNVYFHVHVGCIRMKQPYFVPQMTQLPYMLAPYLLPEHLRLLREFGMQV